MENKCCAPSHISHEDEGIKELLKKLDKIIELLKDQCNMMDY